MITLDKETLKKVVAETVIASLGAEQTNALLVQAITTLLTEPEKRGNSYGPKEKSPLQVMFDRQVQQIAAKEVEKMFSENAAGSEKIAAAAREAWDKFMASGVMTERFEQSLSKAFRGDGY